MRRQFYSQSRKSINRNASPFFCAQSDKRGLDKGDYLDLSVDTDGTIRSRVFPGLWLAVADLLAGNMQRVLAVLQEGVQSPEHVAFVEKLASD